MESQPIIGEALKDRRKQVCLVTKVECTDPGEVRRSVERSLKELQTDHLDILVMHGTPGIEQMSVRQAMKVHDEMVRLRDEKVTRFIGMSAHGYFDKALALIDTGGFDQCMLSYGYVPRGYDQIWSERMTRLRDACIAKAEQKGMGIVAMKVIGAGMLGAWSQAVVPGYDPQRLAMQLSESIARGDWRFEYRHLAVEADRGTRYQGLREFDTGAVDRMARGEVVAAVEHDVGLRDFLIQTRSGQSLGERDDPAFGVDVAQRALAGCGLFHADRIGAMQDLALQVGQVHRVAIGQHQGADPGRGQIEGRRRTQTAGADHQRSRIDDVLLAFDADLRQQDVAAVAQQLLVGHCWTPTPRPPPGRG
jgi:hypothetical protein